MGQEALEVEQEAAMYQDSLVVVVEVLNQEALAVNREVIVVTHEITGREALALD